VLQEYINHYNGHRPHRSLHQHPPAGGMPPHTAAASRVLRRDRLGGLIHEYMQVAWHDRVLGTHSLTKLRLAQIAPTVLTSPLEVDVVVGVSVDGEVVDARIAVIVQHAHGTHGCRTVSKGCRDGRRKCLRGGDPATAAAPGLLA
jgi:hypothetical protein